MFGLDVVGGLISSGPSVPKWKDLTLEDSQTKAISANVSSLPSLEELAGGVNVFSQEQIQKMLERAIPGYNQIKAGISGNIQSLLKGEIPKDVQDLVRTSAAAKSLAGGYAGSGMSRSLEARDLGLTSLGLTEKGLSAAESWIAEMDQLYSPGMFNVTSMFITPQQEFAAEFQNQQAKWSRNWLKNQLDSAYDPMNILGSSLIKTDEQLAQIAASVAGKAAGAAF